MEPKKPINHFIAGLIIGAVIILYSLVLNFTGKETDRTLGWVAYILFVGGIIMFINMYGNARNNELSFGGLFTYGFKVTSIATLLIVICLAVIISVMPDFKQKVLDTMRQAMEDQGKMDDDKIDETVNWFSNNFLLITVGGALFMYILFGAIASLIGAAITKKNPVTPFQQNM